MTSITEKMVAGGSCITRIDGKAVFVPFSLPGETVELEITDSRKDYSFARIVSIIEPSEHRVTPVCPLFGVCGGCSLQMAENSYQSTLRLSILRDILFRSHVEVQDGISVEAGDPLSYRSRFQFHRTKDGRIGFNAQSSNTIVPVSDCPIAVNEIRAGLQDGSISRTAAQCNSGDRFHVFAYKGILAQEDRDTRCSVNILDTPVHFDVRGFFQSNISVLEKMISAVCGTNTIAPISGKRLLDFYAGVGTFSVFAGNNFRETVLVEHNKEALIMAEENLLPSNTKATLCAISDEKWSLQSASRLSYDVAIIDPPRQGLHKKTLEWFCESRIPDIRYVSCDPVTFARDAVKFIAAGYTLKKVVLFDFYPQSHHIETLGFFEK